MNLNISPYVSHTRETIIRSNLKIKDLKEQISLCKQIKSFRNSPKDILEKQIYVAISKLNSLVSKIQKEAIPPLQKGLDKDYTILSILRLIRKLLLEIYAKLDKNSNIISINLEEIDDWLKIEEVIIRNI